MAKRHITADPSQLGSTGAGEDILAGPSRPNTLVPRPNEWPWLLNCDKHAALFAPTLDPLMSIDYPVQRELQSRPDISIRITTWG